MALPVIICIFHYVFTKLQVIFIYNVSTDFLTFNNSIHLYFQTHLYKNDLLCTLHSKIPDREKILAIVSMHGNAHTVLPN